MIDYIPTFGRYWYPGSQVMLLVVDFCWKTFVIFSRSNSLEMKVPWRYPESDDHAGKRVMKEQNLAKFCTHVPSRELTCNISPLNLTGKMIFLFHRWDILVPRRVLFFLLPTWKEMIQIQLKQTGGHKFLFATSNSGHFWTQN